MNYLLTPSLRVSCFGQPKQETGHEPGFVIARSVSDAAIHEYHGYASMDCRAALAMTAGFFVDFWVGSWSAKRGNP